MVAGERLTGAPRVEARGEGLGQLCPPVGIRGPGSRRRRAGVYPVLRARKTTNDMTRAQKYFMAMLRGERGHRGLDRHRRRSPSRKRGAARSCPLPERVFVGLPAISYRFAARNDPSASPCQVASEPAPPLSWTPKGLLNYCPGKSGALYTERHGGLTTDPHTRKDHLRRRSRSPSDTLTVGPSLSRISLTAVRFVSPCSAN